MTNPEVIDVQATQVTEKEPEMLNVNGKSYLMASLPKDILEYIGIYKAFQADHEKEKLAAFKSEAAIKAISIEITTRLETMESAAAEVQSAASNDDEVNVKEPRRPAVKKVK